MLFCCDFSVRPALASADADEPQPGLFGPTLYHPRHMALLTADLLVPVSDGYLPLDMQLGALEAVVLRMMSGCSIAVRPSAFGPDIALCLLVMLHSSIKF